MSISYNNSQAGTVDSLLRLIEVEKVDSIKAHLNIKIAANYMYRNSDSSMYYANQVFQYKESCKPILIAKAHKYIGAALREKGNYNEALFHFEESMKVIEGTNEWTGLSSAHNNLGLVYYDMGNYALALDHLYKGIRIADATGNKGFILTGYINVGLVYDTKDNLLTALKYYHKALKLAKELNDLYSLALLYNNVGYIHQKSKDYDAALRDLKLSVHYCKITDYQQTLAFAYNNIAVTYYDMGEKQIARTYLDSSFVIRKAQDDMFGLGMVYFNYGIWAIDDKNYAESERLLLQSYDLILKTGSNYFLNKVSRGLTKLYVETNRYKEAYQYRDSAYKYEQIISNEKSIRQMEEVKSAFELKQKQREIDKIRREGELAQIANDEKLKRQRWIIYSGLGGVLLLLVFLYLVYQQYKLKTKANHEIILQKNVIQEKNLEIMDSLKYAKRIQGVLLASDHLLNDNLHDYFVLFQPKDIVSGDFYWAIKHKQNFYLIIADCTGHGVPGAFMSLLNISLLRETIVEKNISSPDQILNIVRDRVIESLNPEGSNEIQKDGMDAVVLKFTEGSSEIEFSCANNPVWIYRNKERIEFKPDKMPVGIHGHTIKPFTLHRVSIKKDDQLFVFTDGIADQFGGTEKGSGKKFKYSRLHELLLQCSNLQSENQSQLIKQTIHEWKGEYEQTDDICIFGITFNRTNHG